MADNYLERKQDSLRSGPTVYRKANPSLETLLHRIQEDGAPADGAYIVKQATLDALERAARMAAAAFAAGAAVSADGSSGADPEGSAAAGNLRREAPEANSPGSAAPGEPCKATSNAPSGATPEAPGQSLQIFSDEAAAKLVLRCRNAVLLGVAILAARLKAAELGLSTRYSINGTEVSINLYK